MKKLLTLFAFALVTLLAHAQTEIDGIYYELNIYNYSAIVLQNPNKYTGNVSIPSTVTHKGSTYSVTDIGNEAFMDCINLTSINIPNSIAHIMNNAFYGCTSLTSVYIPNSVTSVGFRAFSECSNLTTVTIENGLTIIGSLSFSSCTNLKNVNIPNSVTSIRDAAFMDCTNLTSINIPNNVKEIGNQAFDGCSSLSSVSIGNGVDSVGYDVFNGCNSLPVENNIRYADTYLVEAVDKTQSTYQIKEDTKFIGSYSFKKCSNLTSITIPVSIISIGLGAFSECSNLTQVNISDLASWCNISFGGNDANPLTYADNFYLNGQKITNLNIPNGVTKIRENAFAYFHALTSVTIPNSVTEIGYSAFRDTGLSYINIPNNVTKIGSHAFAECTNLTNVVLPNKLSSIENNLFQRCKNLTSITIPDNVRSIGMYSFHKCGLKYIILGKKVTSIEFNAFAICSDLTSVFVKKTNPITITSGTFSNSNVSKLYIPKGSLSLYQEADYWKDFSEIIEINMDEPGDMDGNGEISVNDVTSIIDLILGNKEITGLDIVQGDMDGDGEFTVSDVMKLVKIILDGLPQAYLTCPDRKHPHLIDLGLPSGTLWACCNVGATKPEGYGDYYAWGETETKDCYDKEHYTYYDATTDTYQNIGENISGTQYDIAHVKWGKFWQMPTYDQIEELIQNCTCMETTKGSIRGLLFKGENGGSIFLPRAGYRTKSRLEGVGNVGYYLSSSLNPSNNSEAYNIYVTSSAYYRSYYRYYGYSVRPVANP